MRKFYFTFVRCCSQVRSLQKFGTRVADCGWNISTRRVSFVKLRPTLFVVHSEFSFQITVILRLLLLMPLQLVIWLLNMVWLDILPSNTSPRDQPLLWTTTEEEPLIPLSSKKTKQHKLRNSFIFIFPHVISFPLIRWVNEKVGTSRKVKIAPSAVTTLTTENFDALALGGKAALVEFYAPW